MSDDKFFTCPFHGTRIERKVGAECASCVTDMSAPVPTTAEGRAEELNHWYGPLTVTFSHLHERIESLMGRSVWTHELADKDSLLTEIMNGDPATMDDILKKIPEEKRIVVVVNEEGGQACLKN